MSERSKSPLNLGKLRETLITLVIAVVVLRIVLWALLPLLPYIVGGIVLVTIGMVALGRATRL